MSRGRASGPPERRVSKAALRLDLLLFVEGRRTEELYLTDWYRQHRDRVLVEIDHFRGAPLQLVERAVEAQRTEARDAKRQRGRPHDQIWCVFDRDEHPNFSEAIALAKRHGIQLAISNPCLELWFVLHFEDRAGHLERGAAQDRAEALLHCSKILNAPALGAFTERYDQAKVRAMKLEEKHVGDGSPPGSNPSSGVWRLIDVIRST